MPRWQIHVISQDPQDAADERRAHVWVSAQCHSNSLNVYVAAT